MNNDNIYVTKPALPELEEILPYLRKSGTQESFQIVGISSTS